MPKPVSRISTARSIDQEIGRLDVLVNEPSFVQSAERVPETSGDSQKRPGFPWFRGGPVKGLTTRSARVLTAVEEELLIFAEKVER